MTAKATVPNTFAAQAGPIPLNELDGNNTALLNALNENNTLANYYVDAGAANALAVTTQSGQTFTAGIAGAWLDVLVAANNTGASTLTINAGSPVSILDSTGKPLLQDALLIGTITRLVFDGTAWRIQGIRSGAGSITLTGNGFSSPTPFILAFQVVQFTVTASLQNTFGTSTANTFSLTGVPASLQPLTTAQFVPLVFVEDNSTQYGISQNIGISINAASGQWDLYINNATTGWTPSGNKGLLNAYQTFTYLIL